MQQPALYAPFQMYNASPNHYAPQKARKMIENFSYGLQDEIGKGFSSKVFRGKNDTTQETVAIKVIDLQMLKSPVHHQLLQSEIEALNLINHPNVMKLYKVFQTTNNTYLITEFCEGGDLASRIQKGKQTEQFTQHILQGVVAGYREMRRRGIIHRDIKPANILINNGQPKIADFGFATHPNSPAMLPNINVGSPLYMSPQALKQNRYSAASDIWAIGVSVFELLFGQVPWQATSEKELAQKMLTVPVQVPFGVSNECADFIKRCLIVDEQRRITIEEMEIHPWIQRKQYLQPTAGTHLQVKKDNFTQPLGVQPLGEAKNKEYSRPPQNMQDYFGKENSPNKPRRSEKAHTVKEDYGRQKSLSKHLSNQPRLSLNNENEDNIFRSERVALAEQNNKMITEVSMSEEIKKNDHIILSQINFCRYLHRIGNLLERVPFFKTQLLREKVLFFVQKNIMIKINKLKEMAQPNPVNAFNLVRFQEYVQTNSFQKISQVIQSYNQKYALNFSTLWLNLQSYRQQLQQDKKFDAVFDENLTEFESFYIILHSVLRSSIRELDIQLEETLRVREKDADKQLPLNLEEGVVLLDYLVTFYQLTALILDQFNDFEVFAQQSKIEQIAEGKPVRLTYGHFFEIRNKIQQLEI